MSDVDPNDPYIAAWREQFKALMRDKALQMLKAAEVTGWTSISHVFKDPFDDDEWRLFFQEGEIYLLNLTGEGSPVIQVDLESLGIVVK